jgi:hypothetical protein
MKTEPLGSKIGFLGVKKRRGGGKRNPLVVYVLTLKPNP